MVNVAVLVQHRLTEGPIEQVGRPHMKGSKACFCPRRRAEGVSSLSLPCRVVMGVRVSTAAGGRGLQVSFRLTPGLVFTVSDSAGQFLIGVLIIYSALDEGFNRIAHDVLHVVHDIIESAVFDFFILVPVAHLTPNLSPWLIGSGYVEPNIPTIRHFPFDSPLTTIVSSFHDSTLPLGARQVGFRRPEPNGAREKLNFYLGNPG